MTCTVSYEISSQSKEEVFAVAVHKGVIWFGESLDIEVCGIVHCVDPLLCILPDSYSEKVYETEAVFKSFKITNNFSNETQVFPLFSANGGQIQHPSYINLINGNTLVSNFNSSSIVTALLFGRPWGKLSNEN
eukprot:TRINITY_DN3831_c0_g1_i2.p1 TRINITY_DN3831_c0_g1~~TRINITY_DN3831_c0_g1_i2.p1  ORF type:complete len:133 (+),score=25.61 TRINITY_DN3831_c0_g1_i2:1215-1613(+)